MVTVTACIMLLVFTYMYFCGGGGDFTKVVRVCAERLISGRRLPKCDHLTKFKFAVAAVATLVMHLLSFYHSE
jgi:hypothetical protein